MKRIVKKILPFLLFLTGFLPVIFTLFFLFKQQQIRHEMKEKMENQLLCIIVLPEKKVEWVKYKKEIKFAEKLFDIKSFNLKSGTYTFTGLYDDDETALNNYFKNNTDQKNERGNQVLSSLFQLLQSMYPANPAGFLITDDKSGIQCRHNFLHIPSPIKNILCPPPQA